MGFALRAELPHYRYDDYCQWEGRWELIDGIPYAMAPAPSLRHQRLSLLLASLLEEALDECPHCQALQAVDWRIADDTVVQPDNLVICHQPAQAAYLSEPPVLIAEILSPSTARKDRGLKKRIYEAQSVRWYLLLDGETREALLYELEEGVYGPPHHIRHLRADLGPCTIDIDLDRLWRAKGIAA